jgi:hypothetical protein
VVSTRNEAVFPDVFVYPAQKRMGKFRHVSRSTGRRIPPAAGVSVCLESLVDSGRSGTASFHFLPFTSSCPDYPTSNCGGAGSRAPPSPGTSPKRVTAPTSEFAPTA